MPGSRRSVGRAAALAVGCLFALSQTALATRCYQFHLGAYRKDSAHLSVSGVQGKSDLVSVSVLNYGNRGIVHPVQVGAATTTDFVAVGTVKGAPSSGGNCGGYWGTGWEIYTDGSSFGAYHCDYFGTVAANAQDQAFKLAYSPCTVRNDLKWVPHYAGKLLSCMVMGGKTTGFTTAGSEDHSDYIENLTVHYQALQSHVSSTWVNWNPSTADDCQDSPFRLDIISNTDFWVRYP